MIDVYFLAHELGKDVDEILDYPINKFIGWQAYFRIKGEEEAKALKKSKTKGKGT